MLDHSSPERKRRHRPVKSVDQSCCSNYNLARNALHHTNCITRRFVFLPPCHTYARYQMAASLGCATPTLGSAAPPSAAPQALLNFTFRANDRPTTLNRPGDGESNAKADEASVEAATAASTKSQFSSANLSLLITKQMRLKIVRILRGTAQELSF